MQLYKHQKEAIEKLHNGSILCAGVGTGKSLTAIGYYIEKVLPNNDILLYVITTARKRDTNEWESEFLKAGLIKFTKNEPVVDSWNNIGKYLDVTNAFFIFDEQRAVGKGKWSKSFVKIARKNKWIMLTATPGDTWMDYIPVFMANGFYRTRSEFERQHVVYNPYIKYPVVQKYLEVDELIRLREKILVNMFFKKPTTVNEETIVIDYDKDVYNDITKHRWNYEKNRPVRNISELCAIWRKVSSANPERLNRVIELIKKHKKVIIFYNYDYELDALITTLKRHRIAFSEWNGHKHEEIPDTSKWAYLVNYMAGAEGWNCIETDTLIFYSLSYSYKTMEQAKGRIDRLNTPFENLYYYRFRSDSPIDKKIEQCLARKQNFNERAYINECDR